jgi:hypothetical protein
MDGVTDCRAMSDAPAPIASRWLSGALVFAALFWTLDLAVLKAGVPHPLDDSWDDGVVARVLLGGGGLRSRTIYPPLWTLRDPATQTVPLLVHGPLIPLLLALPMRVLGPGVIDHIAWIAGLCALLTVLPIYRLAARHFGPPVGAAAAGLFTVSPLTLAAVHHGLSVVGGAALLACALDLLARDRPRAGAAGLVAGIGYLVRPEFLVAAPVLVLLGAAAARHATAGGRARSAGAFLLGFAVCAAGWWWHHARAIGSPWFNLTIYTVAGYTVTRPEASLMRDFALTPDRWPAFLHTALPGLLSKWRHNLPIAFGRLLGAPAASTGWLALVGVVAALGQAATRRVAIAAVALALIPIAMMTLASTQPLYVVPVLPLCAIGAAIGARGLFERMPLWARRPRAWIGALALLMLPATGPALREGASEARLLERWLVLERTGLARIAAAPDAGRRPVFSDTPDFVAWVTGRPAVWMSREEFERLYGGVSADRVAPGPRGLPERPGADDLWFHADPRDPSKNLGAGPR